MMYTKEELETARGWSWPLKFMEEIEGQTGDYGNRWVLLKEKFIKEAHELKARCEDPKWDPFGTRRIIERGENAEADKEEPREDQEEKN